MMMSAGVYPPFPALMLGMMRMRASAKDIALEEAQARLPFRALASLDHGEEPR